MIIVITSNKLDNPKMYDSNQDFIITALYADRNEIWRDSISKYNNNRFDTYYKSGMNMDDVMEEYDPEDSDDKDEYNFFEKTYIDEVIENIASNIMTLIDYDPKIIVAIEGQFGTQVTSRLNKIFKSSSIESEAFNIFRYYKIASMETLVKSMKGMLNTTFIYPDDPICFSYALYRFIDSK